MRWRNPKNYALAIMIVIFFSLPVFVNAVSQSTMTFLMIEPGSRANGMGNAYTGVVEDAYAGWWNPGATAFNRKTQFAGMHSNWLEGSGISDLYYEYLGWNQYFDEIGNLGVNIVWMDYGSQEHTSEDGTSLGTFSSNEFSASAIYSTEVLPNKIGAGIGFKFLYSYLGPGTGATEADEKGKTLSYAFDIGTKFKDVVTPRFDIGFVIQNIGPDVTYINDEQKDPLPMTMRLGLAYRIFDTISGIDDPGLMPVGSFKQKLTLSADISNVLAGDGEDDLEPVYERFFSSWNGEQVLSVGAEYNYLDMISLRGGYFHDDAGSISGPSFGVGFQYTFSEKYRIFADFGMITGGDLVDYNKTFSLGLEF